MYDEYKNDFELFISTTDEKHIFLEELSYIIENQKAQTLLDIGAGDGLLSIPLSQKVKRYVAIEPRELFVEKLRGAGIRVIQGHFPLAVAGSFDIVLASHSISYKEGYIPFIKQAWDVVRPGGLLLIITYRGEEDDWTRLNEELGIELADYNKTGFETIIEQLRGLGELEIKKVITHVKSHDREVIIQALSFVASNGERDRKDAFLKHYKELAGILAEHYKKGDEYAFPFQHFFLTVKKHEKS